MASNVQIYDPQGDVTFILTTKQPPKFGLEPQDIFSGFGDAGQSSKREGTPSTPSPFAPPTEAASRIPFSFVSSLSVPIPMTAASRPTFSFASSPSGGFAAAASPSPPRFSLSPSDPSNTIPAPLAPRTPSPSSSTGPNVEGKDFIALPATKSETSSAVKEVSMLVSSRHLSLASPVFKTMLQHSFKEGETLLKEGKVEVPLPDDDPVALGILMKILHAQNHLVPKTVDLTLLANLAILVDKYRLHNATGVWADMWVAKLTQSIPKILDKDLVLWICITWVFRKSTEFNVVISVAATSAVDTLIQVSNNVPGFSDLPLPSNMIHVIKQSQLVAVQKALSTIEDLITGLSNAPGFTLAFKNGLPDRICPQKDEDCEAMILGTLLKSARAEGLWPTPLASSFTKTYFLKGLRALRVQSYCGKARTNTLFGPPGQDQDSISHGIQGVIIAAANKLENSPDGLKLEDFK